MKWTDEKPAEAGWYWFNNLNSQGQPHKIVEVIQKGENKYSYINDRGDFDVNQPNARWAGPIPEPE